MRKRLTMLVVGCVAAAAGCASNPGALDRGIAHYRSGQYFFAVDDFNEAVRESPKSVAAYVNRGITRVRLGDLNGAIEDYNRAVQLAPGDPEVYFARGNALVAAGQYLTAVDEYTRAVELSPRFARAWFNRGTARSPICARHSPWSPTPRAASTSRACSACWNLRVSAAHARVRRRPARRRRARAAGGGGRAPSPPRSRRRLGHARQRPSHREIPRRRREPAPGRH